ncbi:acyl-CoA dehydrogenase [Spongiibacter sp. KMU-166]|uniref:Acyl-CoA dehydrogenase n=1 Tax=Spongiibacter thalassae TaxID=2721624 RepID=A0ABX1GA92_9GAMM|nr:acyl-CoA dehydrogenase [Spongiibacter thalassae]
MGYKTVAPEKNMDLGKFRNEICDFLNNHIPDDVWEAVAKTTSYFPAFSAVMTMHKLLATKGWSVVNWPEEYGGPGWSDEQRRIFFEEYCSRGLPMMAPQSVGMVAPAIMKFGTAEQKAKYLPPIASGADTWCQGYSEPNAGSDLVSLQCRADSDGDHYIINGQKTWTTWAFEVDHIFLLVRTSSEGRPQAGITFLLIDSMSLPGMEVRPIIGLDGMPEQAEVFFDNVRVPKTQVLGTENQGWTVAKYLLEHERAAGGSFQFVLRRELDKLRTLANVTDDGHGSKISSDPVFKQKCAELEVDWRCLAASENYARRIGSNHPEAAHMASLIKLESMNLTQHISELALDISGTLALVDQQLALHIGSETPPIDPIEVLTVMPTYLNQRASSIFGGSHQIQRDILAKLVISK